uniref:growth arrest-specific protein 7-like isoform X2 n=1 Tax=Myxine glutinosa TaxID=7769 RepID=UPI00359003B1
MAVSGSLCRALYAFPAEDDAEGAHEAPRLALRPGDTVRVLHARPDGWSEGERDGDRGWFPSAYVQVLEPQPGHDPAKIEETTGILLPCGWLCYTSPQGLKYFVNSITNETTWERPSVEPSAKSPSSSSHSSPSVETVHASPSTNQRSADAIHPRKSSTASQINTPSKRPAGSQTATVNGITFPHPESHVEQVLLKPGEWSYCDYFWADRRDSQGAVLHTGFEVLLSKQLRGRQMAKEMAEFVRERIRIEEEYAKALSKLSLNTLASQEEGTLGKAWAQLKKSLTSESEVHSKFASKLHGEVERPLLSVRESAKKELKKLEHHMGEQRKQLVSSLTHVEKARKQLAERQRDLEVKSQLMETKPSGKAEEDIKKARRKSTQAGDDLLRCVDVYNQTQSHWFEEMVTNSLELESMEEQRVELVQTHLMRYTQLHHEAAMFNQGTIDPLDKALQNVDPTKDRETWIENNQTGRARPVNMEL